MNIEKVATIMSILGSAVLLYSFFKDKNTTNVKMEVI